MRFTRLLLGAVLFGAILLGGAPTASAAPAADWGVALAQAAPTAPGVDIPQAPTEADKDKAKNKLVIGVAAVVLLAIVIYGNRVRAKRRKS
ncbi:hypothetical protein [Actinokineospora enzanensis]|uniref:hypothetical protein n=1 Tax=Actinokineospora enzanensis TaxID=155975 RepID=UPI00036EF40E|nr:hypothetical protein [Actinokineospora enzanensis]